MANAKELTKEFENAAGSPLQKLMGLVEQIGGEPTLAGVLKHGKALGKAREKLTKEEDPQGTYNFCAQLLEELIERGNKVNAKSKDKKYFESIAKDVLGIEKEEDCKEQFEDVLKKPKTYMREYIDVGFPEYEKDEYHHVSSDLELNARGRVDADSKERFKNAYNNINQKLLTQYFKDLTAGVKKVKFTNNPMMEKVMEFMKDTLTSANIQKVIKNCSIKKMG